MKKSGHADLPLHYGRVPPWLHTRMARISEAMVEIILMDYGKAAFLSRMSDPFWFQSLGAVMGMDWHSSGITTSVLGALKKSINKHSKEWGLYVCGGRGKQSRATPRELMAVGYQTGLDADKLTYASRLSAKVDNTAIQDGFQIYLHSFLVSDEGDWTVVQQGMNGESGQARRYHWHSQYVQSFVEEPHAAVCGESQGQILNLVHREAGPTRDAIINVSRERPVTLINTYKQLQLPSYHEVQIKDVDLKRLAGIVAMAYDQDIRKFESLLMLEGVGPRTLQSLSLVSEVIHGVPSRFSDPARFSFAHGGKDGHPFPVPIKVFDETIQILNDGIKKAKLGQTDKNEAIKALSKISVGYEKQITPDPVKFEQFIEKERRESAQYGGRTVNDSDYDDNQLSLFE